ncbi:MAG: hypothetical protein QM786_08870 [Breznakibacter sp.]
MILDVIHTLEDIENRKCFCWDESSLPVAIPAMEQAEAMICLIDLLLTAEVKNEEAFLLHMERLAKGHQNLSLRPWPMLPAGVPEKVTQCYCHDLLIYCGLSYHLIRYCRYWLHDKWHDRFPALCSQLPWVGDDRVLTGLMEVHGNSYPWLQKLCRPELLLPLKEAMAGLIRGLLPWIDKHPLMPMLLALAEKTAIWRCDTLADERECVRHWQVWGEILINGIEGMTDLEVGRLLMKQILWQKVHDNRFTVEAITVYRLSLENRFGVRLFNDEVGYWKTTEPLLVNDNPCWSAMLDEMERMGRGDTVQETFRKTGMEREW